MMWIFVASYWICSHSVNFLLMLTSKFQTNSDHCYMKYLVLFALRCSRRLFTNSEVYAKNAGIAWNLNVTSNFSNCL